MRDFTPLSNELELEFTGEIRLGDRTLGRELIAPRCRFLLRASDQQAHLLWLLDPGASDLSTLGLPASNGEPLLLRAKPELLAAHHDELLRSESPEDLLGIGDGALLNPASYEALGPHPWERPLGNLLPLI